MRCPVLAGCTTMEIPIRFIVDGQRVAPEDATGIPRKTEFDIGSELLPSTDPPREGIVESKFFSVFGPFTLDLTYDGKTLVHHFTREDILKQLDDFIAIVSQGVQPPGVRRKN